MKSFKNELKDTNKMLSIEKKMKEEIIGEEDYKFLIKQADQGVPRAYYILGRIDLLQKEDEASAMKWFELLLKHGNQYVLFSAANFFASFDDLYIDQAMRFLKRAAWRQHPIAKRMLKFMKEHPFELPKA